MPQTPVRTPEASGWWVVICRIGSLGACRNGRESAVAEDVSDVGLGGIEAFVESLDTFDFDTSFSVG